MNINLITHPVTHDIISIHSKEGIKLLKTYINTFLRLKWCKGKT